MTAKPTKGALLDIKEGAELLLDLIKANAAAHAAKGTLVDIPGWGVKIEVRSMSIAEKGALDSVSADMAAFAPAVLIPTCYDPETGQRLWGKDDAAWLAEQPASVIEPLMLAGLKASGVSAAALAGAIDEGKGD